jgi:hypothetical protein
MLIMHRLESQVWKRKCCSTCYHHNGKIDCCRIHERGANNVALKVIKDQCVVIKSVSLTFWVLHDDTPA